MAAGDSKLDYWKKRYQKLKAERAKNAPPDPLEGLSETSAAYIAGIIDGEGCISIVTQSSRGRYEPNVQVVMCGKPVIAWMAGVLKVKYGVFKRPAKPSHRAQFHLRLTGRRAIWLCIVILPWLRVKKRQAELLIKFGDTYPIGYDGGAIIDNAKRKKLKQEMHALNSPNGYRGRVDFVYI